MTEELITDVFVKDVAEAVQQVIDEEIKKAEQELKKFWRWFWVGALVPTVICVIWYCIF
jgi:hypothetical protein